MELKKRKVLIVDDHPIIRQGLKQLIDQEEDLFVCGDACDIKDALKIFKKEKPDIALVDITLEGGISGLDFVKDMQSELPSLVVSMHDETLYAERSLKSGAKGYIMKQEATEQLLTAIRKVLNGGIYLSEKMQSNISLKSISLASKKNSSALELLSNRELEVFELLGTGYSTRQVAEKFNLSIKTIDTYRAHIKRKLNFKNASELVQSAVKWVQKGR